jgi:hypothetical protein
MVDDNANVTESDETNNLASVPMTVLAPDFVPVSVDGVPGAVAPGETYALSWTVENRGTTGVPGVQLGNAWEDQLFLSTNVTYEASDPVIGQQSHIVPFSGASYTNPTIPVTIPAGTAPGSYFLLVRADVHDEVREGADAEGNNVYAQPVVVGRSPVANAGGPYTVAEGGSVQLVGNATDADGESVALAWDLDGNGTFETTGGSAEFSAASIDGPTDRSVTLQACDTRGLCGTAQATIAIENSDPSATLAAGPANEGTPVNVSFADPTDAAPGDRTSLRYAVACDGGSLDSITWESSEGSTAQATCTFDDGPSTAVVRGKVMDDDGGTVEYTIDVQIQNVAPEATFSAPSAVEEGESFRLSFTAPSDPSGADTAAAFTYAFDCGAGLGSFALDSEATCSTVDSGALIVSGIIRDKDGGERAYSATVTATNAAPEAVLAAPGTLNEGDSFEVSLIDVVDPSTIDTAAGFRFAFDCGDGAGYAAWNEASSITCPSTDNGVRTVRAKVHDKDDDASEYTAPVIVENVSPTAVFAADPATVLTGSTYALSLSGVVDASSVDTAAGFGYAFDCGEGFGPVGGQSTLTCEAGTSAGTVTVRGRIQDKDGGVSEYTATVTVNAAGQVLAATVQQPVNRDGTSIFSARRGVVPIKFMLTADGTTTCQLPPAAIVVTRMSGQIVGTVNESVYSSPADSGTAFRVSDCQYIYNLDARSLGAGIYRVDIKISGVTVGSGEFELK